MKKLLALMLAAALALSLVACGSRDGDTPSGGSNGNNNTSDVPDTEETNWEFYEGTEIPTFDSAMDVPLMQVADPYYIYYCGTSEDEAAEYMKLYAALVIALGNEEVDSSLGFAIDTPNGTLNIVGATSDDHYTVLVYFE